METYLFQILIGHNLGYYKKIITFKFEVKGETISYTIAADIDTNINEIAVLKIFERAATMYEQGKSCYS